MAEAVAILPSSPPSSIGKPRGMRHVWMLSAGFVILVIVCGVSVWLFYEAKRDADWVTHTVEVDGQLSEMQLLMHRATSSHYAYILTGSPAYLDLYRRSLDDIPSVYGGLRALVGDSPQQVQRADQLKSLIDLRVRTRAVRVLNASARQGVEKYGGWGGTVTTPAKKP